MEYAALTDVGMVRTNNEDSYVVNIHGEKQIFIVADGMGGHNAGEVASLEACRMIESHILATEGDLEQIMREGVCKANRDIFIRASEEPALKGMGTTVDVCVLRGNELLIAHVGDSRVYILSKEKIRKATKDHSIVGMMVDTGKITEIEAMVHPQRNLITRAVGTAMTVEVDIEREALHSGEWVLMCTDGLTSMVSTDEIHSIVVNAESLEAAVNMLVETAKKNGGTDNITVVLLHSLESEE